MDAIRAAGIRIGVHPLGGAAVAYWQPIAARYGLNIEIVDATVDPAFAFMTLDHDGQIRMDCSSPYAMASLVALKDRFDIALGQRCRRRPPRHRHALGRTDESQPLSRRGDQLPAEPSAAVARGSGRGQDPRFLGTHVTFFWPFSGDYWIVALAPDYEYAVVGTPDRKYLWFLARTPTVEDALYSRLVEEARRQGFDPSRIEKSAPLAPPS